VEASDSVKLVVLASDVSERMLCNWEIVNDGLKWRRASQTKVLCFMEFNFGVTFFDKEHDFVLNKR